MLKISQQKKWVEWPEAKASFQLSPLTVSRRAELMEEATERTGEGKKQTVKFNARRFQDLVAESCIHDWKGLVGEDTTGTISPLPCTPENKRAVMDIEPANIFIFVAVGGLSMHLVEEIKTAGNA